MRIISPADVDLAVQALEAGNLVIVPTDRWYMICCDAGNADACAQIFAAKQRPVDKSLLLVLPKLEIADQLFRLNEQAKLLTTAFWPGDLALRAPWTDPANGSRYAAVGAPEALVTYAPGVLGELARRATCLVAATSANFSGTSGPGPSVSLAEVQDFVALSDAKIPVAIDGGVCPIANHLTIVRCHDEQTEITREGVISSRAVFAALKGEFKGPVT